MNTKELVVKFGKELQKKRIDCDLNRIELSKLCGLSVSLIQRIEKGNGDPRLSTIIKLGKALGENEFLVKF